MMAPRNDPLYAPLISQPVRCTDYEVKRLFSFSTDWADQYLKQEAELLRVRRLPAFQIVNIWAVKTANFSSHESIIYIEVTVRLPMRETWRPSL